MFQLFTLFAFAPELLGTLIAAVLAIIGSLTGAPPA